MTRTLVAVFENFQQAESAASGIVSTIVTQADVQVHALHDMQENSLRTQNNAFQHRPQREGAMQKIEDFFANLFGGHHSHSQEAAHYREAMHRGGAVVNIDNVPEARVGEMENMLQAAGAIDIDEHAAQWTGSDQPAVRNPASVSAPAAAKENVLEAVQEEIAVGKRVNETGRVHVYTRSVQTPFSEAIPLTDETVNIERRPVDRPAQSADLQPASIEVIETTERPVISKTAHVVEEVHVSKNATTHIEEVRDTLHGTKIEVEKTAKGSTNGY